MSGHVVARVVLLLAVVVSETDLILTNTQNGHPPEPCPTEHRRSWALLTHQATSWPTDPRDGIRIFSALPRTGHSDFWTACRSVKVTVPDWARSSCVSGRGRPSSPLRSPRMRPWSLGTHGRAAYLW